MAVQTYDIPEAFSYAYAVAGSDDLVTGHFEAGAVSDPSEAEVAYLESTAIPAGLAHRIGDAPPAPAPTPEPAPEEPTAQ